MFVRLNIAYLWLAAFHSYENVSFPRVSSPRSADDLAQGIPVNPHLNLRGE
jgi:hypothetical protein